MFILELIAITSESNHQDLISLLTNHQHQDVIIEAVYRGLLGGKMDQKNEVVRSCVS